VVSLLLYGVRMPAVTKHIARVLTADIRLAKLS
jgi:hypothetical protein